MLLKLHIHNYAIIDELEINFSDKLNIITGETGAGKSILIGALGLILGDRADSSVLQNKEKKCVVEGVFNTEYQKHIKVFLEEQDLDPEKELTIRREMTAGGKSRAFINDTPVNVNQLKELSFLLIDLHQQFDTLELTTANFHQQALDAVADNAQLLQQYAVLFYQYTQTKKELETLQEQQKTANVTLDYNQFLFNELNELALKENELEDLEAELKLLSNAENIKQQLASIYSSLKTAEQPIVQQLKVLNTKLYSLEKYNSQITTLAQRLHSTQIELQDIAEELEQIDDAISYSQERIQWINDRISAGYKLQKKHGVHSTSELLLLKDNLQLKLQNILNITGVIEQKEKLTAELLQQCELLAATLSTNRKKAIKPFVQQVNTLLTQVGMPNAKFMVELQAFEQLRETGMDKIEFLFDANKSGRFELLRKVASGGELSRLMLCIKSLVAKKLQLPTLIFDEIDTGISGEAARQVGNIMKALSDHHQIISITHQPQIAAKATAHFYVYKSIKKDAIVTSVRLLNDEDRITTIAQMLSGEKPTAAALQNAREMVCN